ncbi:inverse autotransporter beta domain-containing protein, partial [Enterobacter roggenkampii]|uniref:inverse autotransporter beta domain-containing protein n=1 Tax=Enterobacter roggenkampii TaxID=1812935 RepID=UPI002DBA7C0A
MHSVAKRYHLTVVQLKKLNQFRTFSRPFERLHAGDEIDVPVLPPVEGKPAAGNLTKATPDQTNEVERWLAGQTSSLAQATTGRHHAQVNDVVASQARSAAISGGESAVSEWLNQFGTARVQLGVDDHFALNNSALDMLVPLYDNGRDMLFTQFGGRRHDDRTTLNLGGGVRLFRGDWMYGMNAFLDNDITGHNRRVGVGGEAWTDYLKLAANGYLGVTDWHQSRDFEDYDERPANGFDVTANAWLPAYPQLGGTLKYEQYLGDHVGLMGKDTRQKNPKAVTAGLEWTPVPLLTLGTDYRNSGGHDELQMQAQFTWRMGASLKEQLSGDNVAASRTLAGSRLDLVERNNNIVLEYRKQDVIRLTLPENMHGQGGSSLLLTATVNAKHGLAGIDWSAPELVAAGGRITPAGTQGLQVMLPPYLTGTANQYVIHALARDTRHNVSPEAQTLIQVDGAGISTSRSNLSLSLNTLPANGASTTVVTLTLRDELGNPVSGMAPLITLPFTFAPLTTVMNSAGRSRSLKGRLWDVLTSPLGSTAMAAVQPMSTGGVRISAVKETSPGVYVAVLTAGTQAGTVTLTPQINGLVFPSVNLTVGTDASKLSPGTIIPPVTAPAADGQPVHLQVPVIGPDGNPVPNQNVKVLVNGHPITVPADGNGNADIDLPGQTTPGNYDYVVELNGHKQTVSITFAPAQARNVFGVTPADISIVADGVSVGHLTFTVLNAQGEGLAGQKVHVTVPGEADSELSSGATGEVTVQLQSSLTARDTVVTVTLDNGATQSATVHYVAGVGSALIAHAPVTGYVGQVGLSVVPTGGNGGKVTYQSDNDSIVSVAADGSLTLKAPGSTLITVAEEASGGFAAQSVTTAVTVITPTQAQLAASVAAAGATLTSDKDNIDADNTDTATLTFTPVDAQHNPVKGMSEATVGFAATTTLSSGQYTLTGFSENNGVYTIRLKGNTAGTVDVNVAAGFGVTAKTITLKA